MLEANGIPTVIMGCARDIVEHVGVPRFYWSDFPLGHSAGKPHDEQSQLETVAGALSMIDTTHAPRTTQVSPQRWAADDAWKEDFMNIDSLSPAQRKALRDAHEQNRLSAKQNN